MKQVIFVPLALLLFTLVGVVLAQTQPADIVFHDIAEPQAREDALLLEAYFSVENADGRAASLTRIDGASLLDLEDSTAYTVTLRQSQTDVFVTFVVATGGDMDANVLDSIQQTIANFIENAPPRSRFALIRFGEGVEVGDFTDDPNQIITELSQLTPISEGACPYHAINTALEQSRPGDPGGDEVRRAVIVFSNGHNDDGCPGPSSQEIINQAKVNDGRQILYFAPMGDDAGEQTTLSNITSPTGGFAYRGAPPDLSEVAASLNSEWYLSAKLRPTQGNHTAVLLLTLNQGTQDEVVLSKAFPFAAPVGYTVAPFNLGLNSLRPYSGTYTLTLNIINAQPGSQLTIHVWSEDNLPQGSDITHIVDEAISQPAILLKGIEFTPDKQYRLEVQGVDANKLPLLNSEGGFNLLSYEFRHPNSAANIPAQLSVLSAVPNFQTRVITVEVYSLDPAGTIDNHRVRLVNASSGFDAIAPFTLTLTLTSTQFLTMSMQGVPAGEYIVMLEGFDEVGRPVVEPATREINYRLPSLWQRVVIAVREQRRAIVTLLVITVVITLVIVLISLYNRFNNPLAFGRGKVTEESLRKLARHE
jgi:hypothetical protein